MPRLESSLTSRVWKLVPPELDVSFRTCVCHDVSPSLVMFFTDSSLLRSWKSFVFSSHLPYYQCSYYVVDWTSVCKSGNTSRWWLTHIGGLLNFFTSCCDRCSSVGPQIFHFLLWPVRWWFLFLMVTMWTHLVFFFCNLPVEPQPLWNLIFQEEPQVSLSLMLMFSYFLNE